MRKEVSDLAIELYTAWDELPEEFRKQYANQREAVEDAFQLGLVLRREIHHAQVDWRLLRIGTGESRALRKKPNFRACVDELAGRAEERALRAAGRRGKGADTKSAKHREEAARRFANTLVYSIPYVSLDDIEIVWLENGEFPFFRSKLLFGKGFHLHVPSYEQKLLNDAKCSPRLKARLVQEIHDAMNKPEMMRTIRSVFEETKSQNAIEDVILPDIKSINFRAEVEKPSQFEVKITMGILLTTEQTAFVRTSVQLSTKSNLMSVLDDAVRACDFQPCFRYAFVAPKSALEERIKRRPVGVCLGNDKEEVSIEAPPLKRVGEHFIAVCKNGVVDGVLLENGSKLLITKDSGSITFSEPEATQAKADAEQILALLRQSDISRHYGFAIKASIWRNKTLSECQISVLDGEKELDSVSEDCRTRNWLPNEEFRVEAAEKALATVEAAVLKYAVYNEFPEVHLVGGKEKLKAALLSVILKPDTPWRKTGFTRKEVMGMFSRRFPGKYSSKTANDALVELLTAYEKKTVSEEFAVFTGRLMKGDYFDYTRYRVTNEKLAKGILRTLDNSSFQWSDIDDLKTSARFPKFRKLALAAKTSEDAFRVIENLSMLTQGDAANFLKSDAFNHVAKLLNGTDRLLAAVIVRDYPGCIRIAKNLEIEDNKEGEEFVQ